MRFPTDGTDLDLSEEQTLAASYESGSGAPGKLTLRATNTATGEARDVSLQLDLWDSEGCLLHNWSNGGGLLICGADRIILLQTETLAIRASIPLEYGECETMTSPGILEHGDELLIFTESRIFCIDRRLAIRWCWTVRVHSDAWRLIHSPPMVEGRELLVPVRSPQVDSLLRIHLDDGRNLSDGGRHWRHPGVP